MLFISFDGLSYTVPVNPSELTISQKATNSNIDIIGLGKATRKGEPGLKTLKIKSFFPNPKSRYYMNVPASTYIEFIKKIWNTENINNKVAEISSYGISDDIKGEDINMYFVIENFDYTYKGGDFDTEYSLSIKEYRPYGAKKIDTNFTDGLQSARAPSTVKENVPGLMEDTQPTTGAKTYTIGSGDTLWSIAKRATGDGNNWRVLYEANKEIIGANPNSLKAGLVLTLPENWNSPTAIVNTSTSVKLKQGSGTSQTKLSQVRNATASTAIEAAKDVISKPTDSGFGSEEWQKNNQRIMELYNFEAQLKQHKANLNELVDRFKKVDTLGNTYTERTYIVNKDLKELQDIYNKAERISSDPSKTEQQKVKAIQEQRAAELKLYNRLYDKRYERYQQILDAPVSKISSGGSHHDF